ncbi:hypothetical protein A9798_09650 [Edwardsiella hoshinae]|uniref:Uncharacterized protein n=2 Tax=Edwardsiella hoshinae TaxID=93378 RepID=A0ABN4SXU7_9GAMM|nr:hypothetical protein [Edwardsiella hoshinae]AOV97200.1 hypothetical protein A9798_09650 [Edwardsiella hoshinae]QPR26955.1 hypothetical protein I6G97_10835 [Edwardsiella hoshinae]
MDLMGIAITGAAAVSGTALLVTLFIDAGLPRFWQRRPPRAEPRYDRQSWPLTVPDEAALPRLGTLTPPPSAIPPIGQLDIVLPAPRIALGDLR